MQQRTPPLPSRRKPHTLRTRHAQLQPGTRSGTLGLLPAGQLHPSCISTLLYPQEGTLVTRHALLEGLVRVRFFIYASYLQTMAYARDWKEQDISKGF